MSSSPQCTLSDMVASPCMSVSAEHDHLSTASHWSKRASESSALSFALIHCLGSRCASDQLSREFPEETCICPERVRQENTSGPMTFK